MAVQGILIATVANTVVKAGVVAIWGSPRLRLLVLPVLTATALTGVWLIVST